VRSSISNAIKSSNVRLGLVITGWACFAHLHFGVGWNSLSLIEVLFGRLNRTKQALEQKAQARAVERLMRPTYTIIWFYHSVFYYKPQ